MNNRYTTTAVSLHWIVAFGLLGTVALGLYMSDLPFSPAKLQYYSWHKWAGVTLFLLAVVRLMWRLINHPPALPESMPPLMKLAAHGAHIGLYALMFAIPLSGWLMSSAKGFQTVWFGVLPLPDLVAKNPDLGDTLREAHEMLNYLMLGLVVAHAVAAVKHHVIDRDDILSRMVPHLAKK